MKVAPVTAEMVGEIVPPGSSASVTSTHPEDSGAEAGEAGGSELGRASKRPSK